MNDYPVNHATVALYFTTHAADGSPVAPSSAFEVADVKLFKNGSDVERTSNSGWTMTSPFNAITGLHRLLIDLSDNTDAGFYAAGATYAAVLNPDETVDSLSVVKVIGEFSIGFAVAAADVAAIKAKTDSLTFTVAGQVDANVQYVNDVQVNGVGTAGNPWGP